MTIELIISHPPLPNTPAADALLACASLDDDFMIALCQPQEEWATAGDVRTVHVDGATALAAVNVAVAGSRADWVLLLEGDYVTDATTLTDLRTRLAVGDIEVGVLGRRMLDERQAVSAAPSQSAPGSAIVWRRDIWMRLRGLDELAPVTVAGLDLLRRAERAGLGVVDLSVRQLHATRFPGSHAPSEWTTTVDYQQKKLLDGLDQDPTIYRNLIHWSVPPENRPPLVTVAIATRDRARLLQDAIHSVLFQTFQEFEIVVVDDGSEDREAEQLINAIGDPRIRYVWQPTGGISSARNRAAELARGHFTAVHDDDDIMLPWRLERSLAAMTASVEATYGAWANFDELTGAMRVFITKHEFSSALNAFSGQSPGHGTWTLPTELLRRHRYDENLTSSVDHHLASRMVWQGVRWRHVEDVLMLRRVHHGQISNVESASQKAGHVLTLFANSLTAGPLDLAYMAAQGKALQFPKLTHGKDLLKVFGAYLPDHLVRRSAVVSKDVTNTLFAMDMPPTIDFILEERDPDSGRLRAEIARVNGVTLRDLATFRQRGVLSIEAEAVLRDPEASPETADIADPSPPFAEVFARLAEIGRRHAHQLIWLVIRQRRTDEEVPVVETSLYRARIIASASAGARVAVFAYAFAELPVAQRALVRANSSHPNSIAQIISSHQIGDFHLIASGGS